MSQSVRKRAHELQRQESNVVEVRHARRLHACSKQNISALQEALPYVGRNPALLVMTSRLGLWIIQETAYRPVWHEIVKSVCDTDCWYI